jgi:hypothetical protein
MLNRVSPLASISTTQLSTVTGGVVAEPAPIEATGVDKLGAPKKFYLWPEGGVKTLWGGR